MNKTAATKQAADESSISPLGDGWKLSTFDESSNAYRESHSMPYAQAMRHLSAWRVWRATLLLTGCTETANGAEYEYLNDSQPGRWQSWVVTT